ncbi:MAG: 30S ribosomal protein S5 [Candidatus Omnitrophica bacterium]|nr:30S ribosomal protein S5 [Candidatus Omnitrophota bacterium]
MLDKKIDVPETEFQERVVKINRVSKVHKGGKKLSFNALVVVGNGKGKIGVGFGKANEVADAIRKSINNAHKNIFTVNLKGETISHEVYGHFGAADVVLKPAGPGTGVIAGSSVRPICELAGIRNILAKSLGSENAMNIAKATVIALKKLKPYQQENQGEK